jgi:hypothetical protein
MACSISERVEARVERRRLPRPDQMDETGASVRRLRLRSRDPQARNEHSPGSNSTQDITPRMQRGTEEPSEVWSSYPWSPGLPHLQQWQVKYQISAQEIKRIRRPAADSGRSCPILCVDSRSRPGRIRLSGKENRGERWAPSARVSSSTCVALWLLGSRLRGTLLRCRFLLSLALPTPDQRQGIGGIKGELAN